MDTLVERKVFLCSVFLDHEEAAGLVVGGVEAHCHVLEVFQLLGTLVVELQKLHQFGLGLLCHDLAVAGLHHDSLEDGLQRLHVGVLATLEHHWSAKLAVDFFLGLSELLPELLLHNLGHMASVVLHEKIAVSIGAQVELDLLSLVFEPLRDQLLYCLLDSIELVQNEVTVTLSDTGERNLDHVLLSEGLFQLLATDFDTLHLADEEYERSEHIGVLDLLNWLLRSRSGSGGSVILGDRDSFGDFLNFESLLARELWEGQVVLTTDLGLILTDVEQRRVSSGLDQLTLSGSKFLNLVTLLEDIETDEAFSALEDEVVEELVADEVLVGEVILNLGLELCLDILICFHVDLYFS